MYALVLRFSLSLSLNYVVPKFKMSIELHPSSPRARAGYSGSKKLAVMAMRQEIVDAIDQNQVQASLCASLFRKCYRVTQLVGYNLLLT